MKDQGNPSKINTDLFKSESSPFVLKSLVISVSLLKNSKSDFSNLV
jgi:hypothetical protein